MELAKKESFFDWLEEDIPERDFDIYSDQFDDEEAIESGVKPKEAAFMRGFRKV